MQSEHLQQIMDYYIEDAQNHLAIIEQHLLKLQSTIEDPEIVSELFRAARCGIVGGANLLPISSFYINSIHKTGFCLVDCLKVIQQQGSIKIDQKLKDLLMQVFYRLKSLIEQLRQPSNLKDDQAKQVISEIEPIRAALMAHLHGLSHQSRGANRREVGKRSAANVSDVTLQESAQSPPNWTRTLPP
jgi:chemosensory pili system protein ChpA (sensor histidine kinase/response regulator)